MVTKAEARRLVEARISTWPLLAPGDELVIVDASTREAEFGWVFCSQSRMHLETGALRHALAGNAPFIVDRDTGDIVTTGTVHPIEHYIAEYESRHR